VARALSGQPKIDTDAATLLTSELVTNAVQHTKSGEPGGTVTVVVIGIPGGVLVEVVDDGSPGTPIVKGDLYAAEGHGLYLVQQLAAQWGYLRDATGTTVWFHLPAGGSAEPQAPASASTTESARTADVTTRRVVKDPGPMMAGLPLYRRFFFPGAALASVRETR
jgi:hypothetical protein